MKYPIALSTGLRHVLSLTGIAVILLITLFTVNAQKGDWEDVVYLKDGGIIRGKIIEHVIGEKITIQTIGRNVFVFTYEQIEKITSEQMPGKFMDIKQSGYSYSLEVGLRMSRQYQLKTFPILSTSHGFLVKPNIYLGVNISINGDENRVWLFPVELTARYYLIGNSQIKPFGFVSAGYNSDLFMTDDQWTQYYSGYTGSVGLGIRQRLSNHASFLFSVAFNQNSFTSRTYDWWTGGLSRITLTQRRIDAKIGFLF
ncbi:MAG: hypothetical protein IH946_12340 [Bacteroidetes bacterium]|nr:hypothetical protein [Bacteroidota bacterium]